MSSAIVDSVSLSYVYVVCDDSHQIRIHGVINLIALGGPKAFKCWIRYVGRQLCRTLETLAFPLSDSLSKSRPKK